MNFSKKNWFLIIGLLALVWISYSFSFSKTMVEKEIYKELLEQSNSVSDLPSQLSYLKQQEKYYDSILRVNQINSENSFQNNLLRKINEHCKQNTMGIIAFQEPHIIVTEDSEISTYIFKIQGSFKDLIELVHNLEDEGNYGKILSFTFQKSLNYKTKKNYLECEVFLQRRQNLEE